MMHHALQALCSGLSTIWVASLWQGAAIAAAAMLLSAAMPRLSAKLRYQLWAIAYLACVLLPAVECLRSMGRDPSAAHAAMTVAARGPAFTMSSNWSLLFTWLWVAGACFCFARLLAGLYAVRVLLQTATAWSCEKPASMPAMLQAGSRGPVRLLVSNSIAAPVATGFRSPAIVLPHALLPELTGEQRAQVLRHELAHLARRDDWAALATSCIGCLFPLHPALALLRRRLAETREVACDDAVLEAASPRAYAASLAQVAACGARRRVPRMLPGLLGERSQLAGRIRHILAPRQNHKQSARVQLAAAVCWLALVFVILVRCPSLIAFDAQAASAPAPLPVSVTPAVAHIPAVHAATPVLYRVRRRHVLSHSDHLLARTTRPQTVPGAAEQPSAVLVLWTGQQGGFVTTLVLDCESALSENARTHPSFTFLEI